MPHFEKMLYDQALLVRVYVHAAVAFDEPRWRQVVAETVEYVLRDMRHPGGGFSSAEDADSPGTRRSRPRGTVPHMDPDEVRAVLGDRRRRRARLVRHHRTEGNFEGRSIPSRLHARGELCRPPAHRGRAAAGCSRPAQRPRPGLDDKVLTEWNGLMLVDAGRGRRAARRADWIDAAVADRRFLLRELRDPTGGGSGRGTPTASRRPATPRWPPTTPRWSTRSPGSPRRPARRRWIAEARGRGRHVLDHFWDPGEGGLFTTADDGEELVARQKDLFDNATPSANSTAAVALYRLAALTGEQRYANHADRILQLLGGRHRPGAQRRSPMRSPPWPCAERGITEVVVAGDRPDLVAVVSERWRPERRARLGRAVRLAAVGAAASTASPTCAETTPARPRRSTTDGLVLPLHEGSEMRRLFAATAIAALTLFSVAREAEAPSPRRRTTEEATQPTVRYRRRAA